VRERVGAAIAATEAMNVDRAGAMKNATILVRLL
jgi:hypothetical protein